jgi:non-specific serine/threonine protein kinase/serine/threonine-protein kinase
MDQMTPEFWQRIKTIAGAALELGPAERRAHVEQACAGDGLLFREVLSLLRSTEAAEPYFERPNPDASPHLYATGSRIGAYRVLRELGSGGMGTVYLADRDDGEFTQRVAIKIVRGGFPNRFLLERFRDERRILASLAHPNIGRLLDGGTTQGGVPFVVMEYVEGQPIDEYCEARQVSLRDRLALFQQVCGAVEYAHRHLVIHRDIKAANILVSNEGVPKLLDFGIAKLLHAGADADATPQTTVPIMTPESASPEQLSGGSITVAADVYALGVLLYRLVAGVGPYKEEMTSQADLIRNVCDVMPERPSTRAIQGVRVPADVDTIVLKALRKEPERRYASPSRLADDIQQFLEGRRVAAAPDSIGYRVRKFVGRHRVSVTLGAIAVVATITGVAAIVWEARVAQRERARAEHEFNAVRGFAQAMLGEMHQAVAKLPGSTAAQEILLRHATAYLDALSPEAQNDDNLRREVSRGYGLLAGVQGGIGMPNVGNVAGSRVSLLKVTALLEPLILGGRATLDDRLYAAKAFAMLAPTDPAPAAATLHLDRARAIIEGLSPPERSSSPNAIIVRETVWTAIANAHVFQHDYPAALAAQQHNLDAADDGVRASPESSIAKRNLSLAYKRIGALLEVLNRREDAMPLYRRALEVDQGLVRKEPANPLARLDLSFTKASIASLTADTGDLPAAQALFEEAVALREGVVAQDPANDFARVSLARGYERLGEVHGSEGHVPEVFVYVRRRLEVFRQRLDAHPDRDGVWNDYTAALLSSAEACRSVLAGATISHVLRRAFVPQAAALLDEIVATQQRWAREKHTAPLPPAVEAIQSQRSQLLQLLGAS